LHGAKFRLGCHAGRAYQGFINAHRNGGHGVPFMNTTIVVWHPRTRAIALACFSILYLDIDFHPRLTAIVVTNGAGKTSALDAVVVVVVVCWAGHLCGGF
jgi:hypothetical protein